MRSTYKDNACLHIFKNSNRYQLDLQYMSQELVKQLITELSERAKLFFGVVGGGLLVFFFHMQCMQIMIQQVLI